MAKTPELITVKLHRQQSVRGKNVPSLAELVFAWYFYHEVYDYYLVLAGSTFLPSLMILRKLSPSKKSLLCLHHESATIAYRREKQPNPLSKHWRKKALPTRQTMNHPTRQKYFFFKFFVNLNQLRVLLHFQAINETFSTVNGI